MGRLGLAIREAAGDELLPPALTVPIEEPRKEPDERGESTCSDFDLIGVATPFPDARMVMRWSDLDMRLPRPLSLSST